MAKLLAAVPPQRRDLPRQSAHLREGGGPLGGGDRAPGIEDVEGVRALQHVGVRGDGQPGVDEPAGLGGIVGVEPAHGVDVGVVEVVPGHLVLGLAEHLAVGDAGGVSNLAEVADALQGHEDAFHAIGDLDTDGVERLATGLLEVGELGDLQAVEPDLPAQAPGTERGRGPVVLDEPDVVGGGVDAERRETAQVELLGVARVRFEDDLELGVGLQPVRIVAVAGVVGTDRGFGVRDPPRLRSEHPQHCGWVERTSADLGVERLHDHAAAVGPVTGQRQQRVLHGQHRASLGISLSRSRVGRTPRFRGRDTGPPATGVRRERSGGQGGDCPRDIDTPNP